LGSARVRIKIHLGSIFQQPGAPNRADASPRPAPGDAGPLPLRATALLTYAPLPEIEAHLLPMAAEPQPHFGD